MILTEGCHYNHSGHFRYLIHHHRILQIVNPFRADYLRQVCEHGGYRTRYDAAFKACFFSIFLQI